MEVNGQMPTLSDANHNQRLRWRQCNGENNGWQRQGGVGELSCIFYKIKKLDSEVAKVVETQSSLVRQLELVETHQREVD
ncbi:hypothetical protein HPP92_005693 [Vanilla planifolia]|uniref:Uncharacterized protein n=1 Tax=Vanilla planifolia TaxID=51239 RepID=A0A835RSM3_VANPL|nr:hypothetical protein HPP92_005693 [Vanilla planifolia]